MYVAPAELSTLLFALAALTPFIKGTDLTVFCDGLVVVAGVVKGSSAAPELEALHLASHHWAVRIGCRLHIEFVDSGSNVADGPSREGITCAVCAELGVQLRSIDWPLSTLTALDRFALDDWAAAVAEAEQAFALDFRIWREVRGTPHRFKCSPVESKTVCVQRIRS